MLTTSVFESGNVVNRPRVVQCVLANRSVSRLWGLSGRVRLVTGTISCGVSSCLLVFCVWYRPEIQALSVATRIGARDRGEMHFGQLDVETTPGSRFYSSCSLCGSFYLQTPLQVIFYLAMMALPAVDQPQPVLLNIHFRQLQIPKY